MCQPLVALTFALATLSPAPARAEDFFREIAVEVGLSGAHPFRVAAADVNGDDYPDLVLVGRDARVQVFLNLERQGGAGPTDRKFVDFTAESGIGERFTSLAALADVDNDGDADLIVGVYYHRIENFVDTGDRNEVLLNDGEGHFSVRDGNGLHEAGLINTSAASFLDYDRDGNIDLVLGTWWEDYTNEVAGHGYLYRGNGDGTFEDVTSAAELDTVLAPVYGTNVADFDDDGWPDIAQGVYCRDDSQLWRNRGDGTFEEIGVATGFGNGPNCTWAMMPADYDNDRDIDFLHVIVHGYEGAGQIRSAPVVNLGPDADYAFEWRIDLLSRAEPKPQHHGDHYATWFDMDSDGRLDLALTESSYDPALDRLYVLQHDEGHALVDVTEPLGLLGILQPHAAVAFDYDLDGDEDLLLGMGATQTDELRLLRNEIPDGLGLHWVAVKLVPPAHANRNAIGARVTVEAADLTLTREVYAGEGNFSGQRPFLLHFGLGPRDHIDAIRVRWPNAALDETVAHPDGVDEVVVVDAGVPENPMDGTTTGDGGSDDSDGGSGTAGDPTDAGTTDTPMQADRRTGCGCSQPTHRFGPSALLLLLVALRARRQRVRSRPISMRERAGDSALVGSPMCASFLEKIAAFFGRGRESQSSSSASWRRSARVQASRLVSVSCRTSSGSASLASSSRSRSRARLRRLLTVPTATPRT